MKTKSVAVHVRLPAPIIKDLDDLAKERFSTRSGMVKQIVIDRLRGGDAERGERRAS